MAAPKAARLSNALALCSAALRVAYATAFLEARAALDPTNDSDRAASPIQHAGDLRRAALEFVALLPDLRAPKHPLAANRRALVVRHLLAVTDADPGDSSPVRYPEPAAPRTGPLQPLTSVSHLCTAALCAGWEISECVHMWARVDLGSFSHSGRTFLPGPRTPQSPTRDWSATEVRTLPASTSHEPIFVFISHGQIVALNSESRLRSRQTDPSGASPLSLTDLPSPSRCKLVE